MHSELFEFAASSKINSFKNRNKIMSITLFFVLIILRFSIGIDAATNVKIIERCDRIETISSAQRSFCKRHHSLFENLDNGAKFALKQCRRTMKFEKWNCTDARIPNDHQASFFSLDDGTKEAALLDAIRAAGIYNSVLSGFVWNRLIPCPQEDVRNYRPCEISTMEVVERYLATDPNMDIDETNMAEVMKRDMKKHNHWVGMQIAIQTTKSAHHRRSSQCCHQYSVPDFVEVVDNLRTSYLNDARRIKYHHAEHMFVDFSTNETVNDVRLVYNANTVDPCLAQPTSTNGRVCHSGLDQEVADLRCNKNCCEKNCFLRKLEKLSVETTCLRNNQGKETCQYETRNVTNFYCCPLL